jgi:hypothetical protein
MWVPVERYGEIKPSPTDPKVVASFQINRDLEDARAILERELRRQLRR